jgi:hypothetical protein
VTIPDESTQISRAGEPHHPAVPAEWRSAFGAQRSAFGGAFCGDGFGKRDIVDLDDRHVAKEWEKFCLQ